MLQSLKVVALGFLGALLGIGVWIAIELSGYLPVSLQRQETSNFEQRVADYLVKNPDAVAESLQRRQIGRASCRERV